MTDRNRSWEAASVLHPWDPVLHSRLVHAREQATTRTLAQLTLVSFEQAAELEDHYALPSVDPLDALFALPSADPKEQA